MGDSSETSSPECERAFREFTTILDYEESPSATDDIEIPLNDTQHSFLFDQASSDYTVSSDKIETSDSASITSSATDHTDIYPSEAIHSPYKQEQASEESGKMYELSLESDTVSPHQKDALEILRKVLMDCQKIVVVAGAGISVSAGIPIFRSKGGIFEQVSKALGGLPPGSNFNAQCLQHKETKGVVMHVFIDLLRRLEHARPTEFHRMLGWLALNKRLLRLYTQNIDGLDVATPCLSTTVPFRKENDSWPNTVQLHGSLRQLECPRCATIIDVDHNSIAVDETWICGICKKKHDNRPVVPRTRPNEASYRRKTRVVLYGDEAGDEQQAMGSLMDEDLRATPDALIVVGTSLKIPHLESFVKNMAKQVRTRSNGVTVWINTLHRPRGPTSLWSLYVKGPCNKVASQWSQAYAEQCNRSPCTTIRWETMSDSDSSPTAEARDAIIQAFVRKGSDPSLNEQ